MSLAFLVRKRTSPAISRMLASACPNVLVVVASRFVDYSWRSGGGHVVVPM